MKNKILDLKEIKNEYTDKYIIYTRKSTDDSDNQKNSIEYQVQENLRLANREGLLIANISINGLCDNGIIKEHHSGYKSDNEFEILSDGSVNQKIHRPKFIQLIQLLQSKKIKGVIVLSWDRISRNEHDDVLIKKLVKNGVDFRFAYASYENNSSGDLHRDIDGMMARNFSRVISEKVKLANTKLLSEGKCLHISPIGYLDMGSDSKPFDKERAPIVKMIFEKYATGSWSTTQLAKWAVSQGLTTKPMRRKRKRQEKIENVDISQSPRIPRPVTCKTIENILSNPFYIGKISHNSVLIQSKAHQPLIDTVLFNKVQSVLKLKNKSVHYPEIDFQPYRGILKCGCCGRSYSPYTKKGILYFKVKCKEDCANINKNLSFKYINGEIVKILNEIYFTDEEIDILNKEAEKELNKITEHRNQELDDLNHELKKRLDDLDFLSKNKISFIRDEVMSVPDIKNEEYRLINEINNIQKKIGEMSESAEKMFDYILTFSELIKNSVYYFDNALDTEKHEIVSQIFIELFIDGEKIKYSAKPGFDELLSRESHSIELRGSLCWIRLEL